MVHVSNGLCVVMHLTHVHVFFVLVCSMSFNFLLKWVSRLEAEHSICTQGIKKNQTLTIILDITHIIKHNNPPGVLFLHNVYY